jgi:hypothetical protein
MAHGMHAAHGNARMMGAYGPWLAGAAAGAVAGVQLTAGVRRLYATQYATRRSTAGRMAGAKNGVRQYAHGSTLHGGRTQYVIAGAWYGGRMQSRAYIHAHRGVMRRIDAYRTRGRSNAT